MTDHYAVIGNPISHSKSPLIHTEFAKQTGQELDYIAKEIPLDDLIGGLKQLQAEGFKGINITVPFKEQAWEIVTNRDDFAEHSGAINTIKFNDDGSLKGYNTDGIGLCWDLEYNHHVELRKSKILILGAGGAARGVIEPLLKEYPAAIHIANRTASKAINLAEKFSALDIGKVVLNHGTITGSGYDDIEDEFNIIINATSASLQGEVPPISPSLLKPRDCICYDMMYSNTDTAFVAWAKQHGAIQVIDGLGMLVEQAAKAFYFWRGVKPETQTVINLIRNQTD